jgi:hypothetical protein
MMNQKQLNEFVDQYIESFFDGAVNVEESNINENFSEDLPPGFSSSDIETVDVVLRKVGASEEEETPAELAEGKKKKKKRVLSPDQEAKLEKKRELKRKEKGVYNQLDLNPKVLNVDPDPEEFFANPEELDLLNKMGAKHEDPEQLLPPDADVFSTPGDDGVSQMLKQKMEKGGKSDHETPYIHTKALRRKLVVVDEDNQEIDLEDLRQTITKRPDVLLKQNEKISKSGGKHYQFYNVTLPAYKGLWYDEKAHEFKFITTCPRAGDCKIFCYARKGGFVQFQGSFVNSSRIVNFLLNNWRGFKQKLIEEINRKVKANNKKNEITVIRWHDSGDFFNEKYLQIALDISKSTPHVIHYAYTKVIGLVSRTEKPKNFVFNYSYGGLEDNLIKPEDKVSYVVPVELFKNIADIKQIPVLDANKKQKIDKKTGAPIQTTRINFTPENLIILKQRLVRRYKLDSVENVILYKDLIEMPYNHHNDQHDMIYHVIVKSGDGDDAAMRKDVKTVLLFIH